MIVVEASDTGIERARRDGAKSSPANAAEPAIIAALNLAGARRLYVTIPEPFEAGQIVQQARAPIRAWISWPGRIRARRWSNFEKLGANLIVLGEDGDRPPHAGARPRRHGTTLRLIGLNVRSQDAPLPPQLKSTSQNAGRSVGTTGE